MLAQVDFAMGVNDQRAVLNGTYFKITDDSVMLVSCDSFKLAKCSQKTELTNKNTNGNAHLEYAFIVPAKTVNELSRLLGKESGIIGMLIAAVLGAVTLIPGFVAFNRRSDLC